MSAGLRAHPQHILSFDTRMVNTYIREYLVNIRAEEMKCVHFCTSVLACSSWVWRDHSCQCPGIWPAHRSALWDERQMSAGEYWPQIHLKHTQVRVLRINSNKLVIFSPLELETCPSSLAAGRHPVCIVPPVRCTALLEPGPACGNLC